MFKNIINLLACGRQYVVMGKVFMIGVQSLVMLFDENLKLLTMCHVKCSQVFIVGSPLEPILNATFDDDC